MSDTMPDLPADALEQLTGGGVGCCDEEYCHCSCSKRIDSLTKESDEAMAREARYRNALYGVMGCVTGKGRVAPCDGVCPSVIDDIKTALSNSPAADFLARVRAEAKAEGLEAAAKKVDFSAMESMMCGPMPVNELCDLRDELRRQAKSLRQTKEASDAG